MTQTIECGSAKHFVGGECVSPFTEVQVAGQDGGTVFVSLSDQVMEVFVFGRVHRLEAEVVDDEQRHLGERLETPLVGADCTDTAHRAEQPGLRHEQDVMAMPRGGVAQRLSQMGLTSSAWASNQYAHLLHDEAAGVASPRIWWTSL